MSYLEQFRRPKIEGKKGKVLSVRISEDLHKDFVAHCNKLRLTVSEGVTYLLEREIKGVDTVIQSLPPVQQVSDGVQQVAVSLLSESKQTSYKRMTLSKPRSSSRFSIVPYSIGNMTACPLCNEMTSKGNYARHIKDKHNYFEGTEQFIAEHQEKVLEVLEREKAKQAT